MPAILDLIWVPTKSKPTPPPGQAPAIVRNSTYPIRFRLWADADKTTALVVPDGAEWFCQLRENRVAAGETPGDPLAEAVITLGSETVETTVGPVVVAVIQVVFSKESTKDITSSGFWDLDQDVAEVRDTLYMGKFRCLDDTTRES